MLTEIFETESDKFGYIHFITIVFPYHVINAGFQAMQHGNNDFFTILLLLLVWQAPLGVRSAKRRHQSPGWTILSHSYRLIQWEIVWSQVLLDSLHSRSSRTSWWFPPVLRRGSTCDTPGICLVWYSCNVAKQRNTLCLDNSRGYCPFKCPHMAQSGKQWTWPTKSS